MTEESAHLKTSIPLSAMQWLSDHREAGGFDTIGDLIVALIDDRDNLKNECARRMEDAGYLDDIDEFDEWWGDLKCVPDDDEVDNVPSDAAT